MAIRERTVLHQGVVLPGKNAVIAQLFLLYKRLPCAFDLCLTTIYVTIFLLDMSTSIVLAS
jgi:hypothetical protein